MSFLTACTPVFPGCRGTPDDKVRLAPTFVTPRLDRAVQPGFDLPFELDTAVEPRYDKVREFLFRTETLDAAVVF
jgi:hypothetical protein